LNEEWEFCCGPKRKFWRRVPYTRKNPSLGQRKLRMAFAEISSREKHFGKVVTPDGREMPAHVYYIGEKLRGVSFRQPKKEPPIDAKIRLLAEQLAKTFGSDTANRLLEIYRRKRATRVPLEEAIETSQA
jgi:hypothetical protein